MTLFSLYSCSVNVQYKSYLLSKAMLFTFITTLLNLFLPFIVAFRSRGFWLKSYSFYEQPAIQFTYNYILIAETDDPSVPIICGDAPILSQSLSDQYCSEFKVKEEHFNNDKVADLLRFKFKLNVPTDGTIYSIIFLAALDFQITTTCPLHMQALSVIEKDFSHHPSAYQYYGDLNIHQTAHLACLRNQIDVTYNSSILDSRMDIKNNVVDSILEKYFLREVTTQTKKRYSKTQHGRTSDFMLDINIKIPEQEIHYIPSFLQEFKWAWPQYLSLVVVFYWIFNKIKCFVFSNRLILAWRDDPWNKK